MLPVQVRVLFWSYVLICTLLCEPYFPVSLASVDFFNGNQVVRTDTFDLCLLAADNNCPPGSTASQYFGIQLQGGIFATEVLTSPPAIAFIDNDSAAEK